MRTPTPTCTPITVGPTTGAPSVPVDISFSQWHSIIYVGADAIYIRGAGAGTDTNHYWIGTFEP